LDVHGCHNNRNVAIRKTVNLEVFEIGFTWLSLPVAVWDEVIVTDLKWVGRFEDGLNDTKDRVLCLARTRTEAATEAERRIKRVASLEEREKPRFDRLYNGWVQSTSC
jgi:hypothetical protein